MFHKPEAQAKEFNPINTPSPALQACEDFA
jgi:hypothetical protein